MNTTDGDIRIFDKDDLGTSATGQIIDRLGNGNRDVLAEFPLEGFRALGVGKGDSVLVGHPSDAADPTHEWIIHDETECHSDEASRAGPPQAVLVHLEKRESIGRTTSMA